MRLTANQTKMLSAIVAEFEAANARELRNHGKPLHDGATVSWPVNGNERRTLLVLEDEGLVRVKRRDSYSETRGAFGRGNYRRHYYVEYYVAPTDDSYTTLKNLWS